MPNPPSVESTVESVPPRISTPIGPYIVDPNEQMPHKKQRLRNWSSGGDPLPAVYEWNQERVREGFVKGGIGRAYRHIAPQRERAFKKRSERKRVHASA